MSNEPLKAEIKKPAGMSKEEFKKIMAKAAKSITPAFADFEGALVSKPHQTTELRNKLLSIRPIDSTSNKMSERAVDEILELFQSHLDATEKSFAQQIADKNREIKDMIREARPIKDKEKHS